MRRFAELTAKSLSLLGKAISKKKHFYQKTFLAGIMFLACGFFCLFFLFTVTKDSSLFQKLWPFALAQELNQEGLLNTTKCIPLFSKKPTQSNFILNTENNFCEENSLTAKEAAPKKEEVGSLERTLLTILEDSPMKEMSNAISKQDQLVAAFLVGIAFKESKFGVYSPKKNGDTCYNYWGYKGGTNPTKSGYSCFTSPEQAVAIVGSRIRRLSIEQNRTTPAQMTIWKCGSSCATHSPGSVQKWIADVNIFYLKIAHLDI